MVKVVHDAFELMFAHPSVSIFDRTFRHEFGDFRCYFFDVFDSIVDKVNLAATFDFPQTGLANNAFIPLRDKCLDRQPGIRRCRDQGEFSQAAQRHVQRARYRCCR